jgi:hypothetical protein
MKVAWISNTVSVATNKRRDKHPCTRHPCDEQGPFCDWFWAFLNPKPIANGPKTCPKLPGSGSKSKGMGCLSGGLNKRPFWKECAYDESHHIQCWCSMRTWPSSKHIQQKQPAQNRP